MFILPRLKMYNVNCAHFLSFLETGGIWAIDCFELSPQNLVWMILEIIFWNSLSNWSILLFVFNLSFYSNLCNSILTSSMKQCCLICLRQTNNPRVVNMIHSTQSKFIFLLYWDIIACIQCWFYFRSFNFFN